MKVAEIMSRPVYTVTAGTPLKEATRLLIEHGVSALPVLSPKGVLVGIVSEADLMPMQTRPDPRSQATPLVPSAGSSPRTVGDVMTRRVVSVRADSEASQAARTMLEEGIKRVPVLRGRRLVGIVSRRDLVRLIARPDDAIRPELVQRLREAGVKLARDAVKLDSGIATIELAEDAQARRLSESVALSVPGVLEVSFVRPHVSVPQG